MSAIETARRLFNELVCEISTPPGIASLGLASGVCHDRAVYADSGIHNVMIFVRSENGGNKSDQALDFEDFATAFRCSGDGPTTTQRSQWG
ncbi:MAG: hypothetical protein AAFN27_14715 [Pseudomonadota bacterium]